MECQNTALGYQVFTNTTEAACAVLAVRETVYVIAAGRISSITYVAIGTDAGSRGDQCYRLPREPERPLKVWVSCPGGSPTFFHRILQYGLLDLPTSQCVSFLVMR